jgi:hypothetical protein
VVRTFAVAVALAVCASGFICRGADPGIDLAAIITKQDAQAALGEPVKDAQARSEEGADGYYSHCNYYSENPGRSLVVRVRQASGDQLEPKRQLEEMIAGNPKFKAVSGLGEKAVMLKEGPDRGPSHAMMLYAVKANAFVTVAISGIDDEKAATEKAKGLAKKILGKL